MLKRSLTIAGLVAVALFCAGPAVPQSAPPDAVAAARDLVAAMKLSDQFKTIVPMLFQTLKPAIVQGRPQIERDYDQLVPAITDAGVARLPEVLEMLAALYARHFTASEIGEIATFYRGPTGQKFLEKFPALSQESMALGQKFGQSLGPEIQKRMIEELRKRGHNI
jgi:uncharacterized protein